MVWRINLLLVTWTRVILWLQQLSNPGYHEPLWPAEPSRRATRIIGSEATWRTQLVNILNEDRQCCYELKTLWLFLILFISHIYNYDTIALDKWPYRWTMISLHFISRSHVQMQTTDLVFVSIVCGGWVPRVWGVGDTWPSTWWSHWEQLKKQGSGGVLFV